MKIKGSLKLFCNKCYLIKRKKKFYVFCLIKKKHKQRQKSLNFNNL